jgi:hypothetical protein
VNEQELHYLRSILGNLRELRRFADSRDDSFFLGMEVLADNIDWLDCFIDKHERSGESITEPEYPRPDSPPHEWIAWYRWKIGDMDRLLQAAYREVAMWHTRTEQASQIIEDNVAEIERLGALAEPLRIAIEALEKKDAVQREEIKRLRGVIDAYEKDRLSNLGGIGSPA